MPCTEDKSPSFLDKAIFIKNFVLARCETPWQIMLQTGGRADLNLVLGFVNTSPKDFVRFLLRPKGARTQRHGIRNLLTSEAAAEDELIPDTAKLAADKVRLLGGWEKPVYSDGIMHIWDIVNHVERVAYAVMVVNLIEDFAFDWYSGILIAPETNCVLGHGTFGSLIERPGDTDYRRFHFNFSQPTNRHCRIEIDGIHFDDGLWWLQASGSTGTDAGSHGSCDVEIQMRLGVLNLVQCGKSVFTECHSGGPSEDWSFARMIKGPDVINFDAKQLNNTGVTLSTLNVTLVRLTHIR